MSSGFEEIQEEDLMAPETSNEPLTPPASSVEPVFTESAPPASVFGFDNETHHDINDVDQIDPYADKEGHFEQEDVTSSYENIIPPQVRRGWGVFFSWAATTAVHVKETAMEINNSETVKEMKTKTTEAMTPIYQAADPLWQKTVETAAPIWVRTKESLAHAADVTSESAAAAAENVMPTLDAVIIVQPVFSFMPIYTAIDRWCCLQMINVLLTEVFVGFYSDFGECCVRLEIFLHCGGQVD